MRVTKVELVINLKAANGQQRCQEVYNEVEFHELNTRFERGFCINVLSVISHWKAVREPRQQAKLATGGSLTGDRRRRVRTELRNKPALMQGYDVVVYPRRLYP